MDEAELRRVIAVEDPAGVGEFPLYGLGPEIEVPRLTVSSGWWMPNVFGGKEPVVTLLHGAAASSTEPLLTITTKLTSPTAYFPGPVERPMNLDVHLASVVGQPDEDPEADVLEGRDVDRAPMTSSWAGPLCRRKQHVSISTRWRVSPCPTMSSPSRAAGGRCRTCG